MSFKNILHMALSASLLVSGIATFAQDDQADKTPKQAQEKSSAISAKAVAAVGAIAALSAGAAYLYITKSAPVAPAIKPGFFKTLICSEESDQGLKIGSLIGAWRGCSAVIRQWAQFTPAGRAGILVGEVLDTGFNGMIIGGIYSLYKNGWNSRAEVEALYKAATTA